MAYLIATESDAASIGGKTTSNGKKCCTYSRATALGCATFSGYASNRLVPYAKLKASAPLFTYTVNSSYADVEKVSIGSTVLGYYETISLTSTQWQDTPTLQLTNSSSYGVTFSVYFQLTGESNTVGEQTMYIDGQSYYLFTFESLHMLYGTYANYAGKTIYMIITDNS